MRSNAITRANRGLTLLELLIALAVVAVVGGLGVPALRNFSLDAQRVAAVNAMLGAIRFARSAALTRDATAVLCKTSDRLSCANAATDATHWMVALGAPLDSTATDAQPRVLRVIDVRFSGNVRSNRSTFEFRPFPSRSTNGTISFCDARGGTRQRAVIVSHSGRPRIAAPPDENGLSACESG